MNILFVDTETTGLTKDQAITFKNIDNWPTIRQIAWLVYEKNGNIVKAKNYSTERMVIPGSEQNPGYVLPVIIPIHEILPVFLEDLSECDVIVGHNIDFDVNVILSELYRYGLDTDTLKDMQRFCTMRNSIELCGFDTNHGDRFPKLQELYSKLFHKPFSNAHDAYCDIKATAECYWEMISKRMFTIVDFPFLFSSRNIKELAISYIDRAVDMVKKYVERGCRSTDVPPITALSFFDKALQLGQYTTSLNYRVGEACLQCARSMYNGGDMTTSFRFFEKAAETDYGEALAAQAGFENDIDKKEALLLKAIEKGWIDAAHSLYFLYKKKGNLITAKKYSEMWMTYCEENFDSLPYNIAVWYIRGFLFGDLDHSENLEKAKSLCKRAIANGLDNYDQYAKALELTGEWDERYGVLNMDYNNCMHAVEELGGIETIKGWGHSNERQYIIRKLSPIVECLFEGKGTNTDYIKAKEYIDFAIDLYDGHTYGTNYHEFELLYYYLGLCYEKGLAGCPKDDNKAFQYYELASRVNNDVLKKVGIMYLHGIGCEKDKKKALDLFTELQKKGIDVSQYIKEAKSWFS